MKTFKQHLVEAAKKGTPEWHIAKLEKTEKSVMAFKRRTPFYSMNNRRALELMDRYNDHKKALYDMGKEGIAAWKEYCKKTDSHPSHDGGDLFA